MDQVDTFCWMRELLIEIYTENYRMFSTVVGESNYLIIQLVF